MAPSARIRRPPLPEVVAERTKKRLARAPAAPEHVRPLNPGFFLLQRGRRTPDGTVLVKRR